jgi:hypothetical protein
MLHGDAVTLSDMAGLLVILSHSYGTKKKPQCGAKLLIGLAGAGGFEPPYSANGKRATPSAQTCPRPTAGRRSCRRRRAGDASLGRCSKVWMRSNWMRWSIRRGTTRLTDRRPQFASISAPASPTDRCDDGRRLGAGRRSIRVRCLPDHDGAVLRHPRIPLKEPVTITSTFSLTRSAANPGIRSKRLSVQRYSTHT